MSPACEDWPLGPGVRVLERDSRGLTALDKPVGVRAHPNTPRVDPRALLRAPYDSEHEVYRLPDGGGEAYLLNRLDAPTSGVLLVATDLPIADRVRRLFAARRVEKVYYAWVRGSARGLSTTWRDRYHADRRGGVVRARFGRGDEAVTTVRFVRGVEFPATASLLELCPKTGRTHQLRVQCSERGMPIIGDGTYGDFRLNREFARTTGEKRLFLHAFRIAVRDAELRFSATAPLPESFEKWFGGSGPAHDIRDRRVKSERFRG